MQERHGAFARSCQLGLPSVGTLATIRTAALRQQAAARTPLNNAKSCSKRREERNLVGDLVANPACLEHATDGLGNCFQAKTG